MQYLQPLFYTFAAIRTCFVRDRTPYDKTYEAQFKAAKKDLLEREGIRGDLQIRVQKYVGSTSYSNICCSKGRVYLDSDELEVDEAAVNWTTLHEIAHVRGNHFFLKRSMGAITAWGTKYGFSLMVSSFVPAAPIAQFAGEVIVQIGIFYCSNKVYKTFSRHCENLADDFANKHASKEELLGGRRMLVAYPQYHDDTHPNTQTRVNKIDKRLRELNVDRDAEHDKLIIGKLWRIQTIQKIYLFSTLEKKFGPILKFLGIIKKVMTFEERVRERFPKTPS